jgi:peptidoglycan/LPS O-acetylase OafA/YrhL
MIFSFLLPLMVLLARRLHWGVLVIGSVYLLTLPAGNDLHWYAIDFSLGIAAYQERERLARWLAALSTPLGLLWLLGATAVFSLPHMLWTEPWKGVLITRLQPLSIFVLGLGSIGLVIAAAFVPIASRLLSTRPVALLGKLSFSSYLLHYTLLILLAPIVDRPTTWPFALLLLALVLGGTLGLSALTYRWVERPAILAGNRVCDWIAARAHTNSLPSHLIGESPR